MLTPSNDTSINNALQIGLINTVTTTTSHTKQKQPLNPATVGTFTGWGAMIIMLPWLIFWDGTHWNQYITKPMLVSNADPTTISIVYFLLIINTCTNKPLNQCLKQKNQTNIILYFKYLFF